MEKSKIIRADVLVIGGGPAGMMAAGKAAELGAKVILLEKNSKLGRKLLLTGQGRCNLTQAKFDFKELVQEYGREGDFLFSPFSSFGVKETIEFFKKRGLALKIERGKRVFPKSDKAESVLKVLTSYLKEKGVEVKTKTEVKGIIKKNKRIIKVILKNHREIVANNYIIATGGKSYPKTGSTGDGYQWLKELGHQIIPPRPALVPLKIKEDWPKRVQGLSLKNVELTLVQDGKKRGKKFGEMLFTHFGLSGPIVLNLSEKVGDLLPKGRVDLLLDLKPALSFEVLRKRIESDFLKYSKRNFRNSLVDLLPQKLIPIIIELAKIDPFKKVNALTKEEKHNLVLLFKNLKMEVLDLAGFKEAIITSGGLSLKEIEAKTMKSKIIDNLFLAGEIINLQGPSGGYNLQLCWTTGYLAGLNSSEK